jgi:peroxiredoxin
MPVESRFVRVGERAPSFTLQDVTGEEVALESFRGRKYVVLVFLRGFF